MTEYDEILKEARTKVMAFRSLTAKEYIHRMYWALRNESVNVTPQDSRARIEKDCIDLWEKRTIVEALPDEAKDLKKQKAGRLSQKKPNSAAVSAAQSSSTKNREVMIDIEGKAVENDKLPPPPLTTTLASTVNNHSPSSDYHNQLQKKNEDILDFEVSFSLKTIWGYLIDLAGKGNKEDQIWFNCKINKITDQVIAVYLGRLSEQNKADQEANCSEVN